MARTQLVKKKLEGYGHFMDLFHTQTDIMRKLNQLRILLAQFNQQSAERRLGMLKQFHDVYTDKVSQYKEQFMLNEGGLLLAHLIKQLEKVGKGVRETLALPPASAPPKTLMVSLRVMLEILRLYRALTASSASTASTSPYELLDSLDNFLREVMGVVRDQCASSRRHTKEVTGDAGMFSPMSHPFL